MNWQAELRWQQVELRRREAALRRIESSITAIEAEMARLGFLNTDDTATLRWLRNVTCLLHIGADIPTLRLRWICVSLLITGTVVALLGGPWWIPFVAVGIPQSAISVLYHKAGIDQWTLQRKLPMP